jgi:class 3 adenylate cyclase
MTIALRAVLRAYQNAVAGEVVRFAGHVAKFMGDGVLAYFGWPMAHEDAAERAVRAVRAGRAVVAAVAGLRRRAVDRRGAASGQQAAAPLAGRGRAPDLRRGPLHRLFAITSACS